MATTYEAKSLWHYPKRASETTLCQGKVANCRAQRSLSARLERGTLSPSKGSAVAFCTLLYNFTFSLWIRLFLINLSVADIRTGKYSISNSLFLVFAFIGYLILGMTRGDRSMHSNILLLAEKLLRPPRYNYCELICLYMLRTFSLRKDLC